MVSILVGRLPLQRIDCLLLSYNETLWGPSGNMTINGTSTNSCPPGTTETLSKRGVGAGGESNVNLTSPPYAIHNGQILYYSV